MTSRSRASDLIKKARLAELKIVQASKEAKRLAEEERKQAEEECRLREEKRRLEEQRQIRELEYEAERLRLEAQIELEQDPVWRTGYRIPATERFPHVTFILSDLSLDHIRISDLKSQLFRFRKNLVIAPWSAPRNFRS